MSNFLTLNFWFNLRPGVFLPLTFKFIIGFIVFMVVLAVIAGFGKKRWSLGLYGNLWNNLYYFFIANAIIGLALTFFNYEAAPFLSARFWFLLWFISMAVWLFFIYKAIRTIPQKKAQLDKERQFRKYLPK